MSSSPEALWIAVVGDDRPAAELPRQGVLSIGSSERADLRIAGQGIDEVHCAIGRIKTGGWALKDLGSAYGTLVNGKKVQSARLAAGDQILVGSRRLRVLDSSAAKTPAAGPSPARAAAEASGEALLEPIDVRPAALPESPEAAPGARAAPLPEVRGFKLERLLGRGGMGSVYLAVQESLQRQVALKVLSPRLAGDADFVARFVAEARAAAALHHPNVVTVFDVGEEAGLHYLAMEFMDRGNLEARVAREGPLPWELVVAALRDAARGLEFAEQKGIVHRDIKPANLMQNAAGHTKIADLGLATHLEAEAQTAEDRKVFGTPHFIAPEQARGERVDARSDLYSLGATAYRLLSGRTPFEGESTREILRAHFTEIPARLDTLVDGLPPDLAALVERLLAKAPADRYPSAAVLARDLDALARGAPLGAAGAAGAAAPKRRRGLWVAALGALALAAAFVALRRGESPAAAGPGASASAPEIPAAPDPEAVPALEPPAPSEVPKPPALATPGALSPGDSEDAGLEAAERAAEAALASLAPDLAPEARAAALREIGARYAGTTAASRAQAEVVELESRLASSIRSERAQSGLLEAETARLREAAGLASDSFTVASALAALAAPAALAVDDAYLTAWRGVAEDVAERGVEIATSAKLAAAELEARGEFDASAALLEQALERCALPAAPIRAPAPAAAAGAPASEVPPPAGEALAFGELERELERLRALAAGLGGRRAHWAWRVERDDASATAAAFGGPDGLERELCAMDFAAAERRLAGLEPKLGSAAARERCAAWRRDVAQAGLALEILQQSFGRDAWRRRTILDPRSERGTTQNAVAIEEAGIRVEAGAGTELIPWSAFGASPRAVHQLFHERLTREYTPGEVASIEALLRIAAVANAVRGAAEMFEPSRAAHFSPAEGAEIAASFEVASEWAERGGDAAPLASERAAAAVLTRALASAEAGAWSAATVGAEELFARHADTLLVRLLSDGSGFAGDPPEEVVAPEAAAEPDASAPEGGSEPDASAPENGSEPESGDGR